MCAVLVPNCLCGPQTQERLLYSFVPVYFTLGSLYFTLSLSLYIYIYILILKCQNRVSKIVEVLTQ